MALTTNMRDTYLKNNFCPRSLKVRTSDFQSGNAEPKPHQGY